MLINTLTGCSSDSDNNVQRISNPSETTILGKWNLDYVVINGAMHTYTEPGFCERNTSEFKLNYQYTDRIVTNFETCFVTQYDRGYVIFGDELDKDEEMFDILELSDTTLKISSQERSFIQSYTRSVE